MKKKVLLSVLVNVLLVGLAVLLAFRTLGPLYAQKEGATLTTLGQVHTELAAERMAARLNFLRDELKENALRLVDPARGPNTLDVARWTWMRVQDHDWRAPNYLEPFPPSRTDVDTWALTPAKNSLTLSERIPIVKNGVQDFVLIEGGFKPTVFNELQSDARFGLWVFDLEAYKKGGLSSAKLFERMSPGGSLGKDELTLLTSDVVGHVMAGQVVELPTKEPWTLSLKKPASTDRVGILGFWPSAVAGPVFDATWMALLGALAMLALLTNLVLSRIFRDEVEPGDAESLPPRSSDSLIASPLVTPYDASVAALRTDASQTEQKEFIRGLCVELAGTLKPRGEQIVSRILVFTDDSTPRLESVDLEMLYLNLERDDPTLVPAESFFETEMFRAFSESVALKSLIQAYSELLKRIETGSSALHVSGRQLSEDTHDETYLVLTKPAPLAAPFVRLAFQSSASDALSRAQMLDLFTLHATRQGFESVELHLSVATVERLQGRLSMRSVAGDNHTLYLDLPIGESRRPEDLLYVKQLKELPPANPPEALAEERQVIPGLSVVSPDPSRANLASDAARAQGRFRIRKPGEKR